MPVHTEDLQSGHGSAPAPLLPPALPSTSATIQSKHTRTLYLSNLAVAIPPLGIYYMTPSGTSRSSRYIQLRPSCPPRPLVHPSALGLGELHLRALCFCLLCLRRAWPCDAWRAGVAVHQLSTTEPWGRMCGRMVKILGWLCSFSLL